MAGKNNEELFRKKSLDKVKSPENLDDYIQVSNPGVWLLLISVVILLAGACVWGIFGHIDSTVETSVRADNETLVCFVANEAISSVQEGMTVKFNGFEAVIAEIGTNEENGYVCVLKSGLTIPDGSYEGIIVTKSIKPLSFIMN